MENEKDERGGRWIERREYGDEQENAQNAMNYYSAANVHKCSWADDKNKLKILSGLRLAERRAHPAHNLSLELCVYCIKQTKGFKK